MTAPGPSRIHPLAGLATGSLPADGGDAYNRLIFEASPYLLQHATNPVDWYPWGEAAFARARELDRPIFLSIGYATCHWCHVMAHECFEDDEVAALLNRGFVAVKVDREERPDVDQIYMQACQMLTGSGGWPLTLLLTPERQPFYAATYLPKHPRPGSVGLLQLLRRVLQLWLEERPHLEQLGEQVRTSLQQLSKPAGTSTAYDEAPLREALQQLRGSFDPLHGGFGPAPKFPTTHQLLLLLRLSRRFADPGAAALVYATLRGIRRGGIIDQVGGGIHRYSVDARWLVPHFEKMLYDQALLVLTAVEAWQHQPDPQLADLTQRTLDYLLRDLRDPGGAFYSGEDADSEGEEGTFYLWSPEEVEAVLGPDRAAPTCRLLGISATGNFGGRCIPHLPDGGVPPDPATLDALLRAREQRPRPLLDDKILTGWNGLAVAALARTGVAFGEPQRVTEAACAARFLLEHLRDDAGRLQRCWCRGRPTVSAHLEDYAALAWGLLELHQATLQQDWLDAALKLARELLVLFADGAGGLFDSPPDPIALPARPRSWQDGAIPAPASLACWTLLRLGRLADEPQLAEAGETLLRQQLASARRYPAAASLLLCALDFALGPATLVTLEGVPASDCATWLAPLRRGYQPNLLCAWRAGTTPQAQVCHAGTCLPPFSTPQHLADWLHNHA